MSVYFPATLQRITIAMMVAVALLMPVSVATVLSTRQTLPPLTIDAGPFYIAGFQAQLPICAHKQECEPAITGPARQVYEVWVFTRPNAALAAPPRVDMLLQLDLRD